jgi:steroid delta-isomerase-like uncharacterized protein
MAAALAAHYDEEYTACRPQSRKEFISMAEKDNLQFAKQAIAAVNAHDIDRYLQLIDSSYVAESETLPAPIHGHEGARQFLTMMFQAFPDFHLEVEEIIASGDHVVTRVVASGTHKGTFAGVPATNKKATWHACNVVRLKNGKTISSRIYADNVSLMRQLGVLPVPKAAAG